MTRLALLLGLVVLAGCEERIAPTVTGLQSFAVELVSPAPGERGTPDSPIRPTEVIVNVLALDAEGGYFEEDLDVDVYLSFAGNKIGQLTPCGTGEDTTPLATLHLAGGVAQAQTIKLLRAYGSVNLWVEEHVPLGESRPPRAWGASPEMWFPYPLIPEVQTPADPKAPTAAYCSPFNGKQVIVVSASGAGKLVVTSIFAGGYVVADTGALYDPVTKTGGYNHLYVFTFGRPPEFVEPGKVLSRVQGNFSKFVGFSELNFPNQEATDPEQKADMPPVITLTEADAKQTQKGGLLPNSGATVTTTATICPIDQAEDDWKKYNQFAIYYGEIDPDDWVSKQEACDIFDTFSVALPAKTLGTFNPLENIDRKIQVTGMLRNMSGQNEATTPPTPCTDDAACKGLGAGGCVEGTCKRGPYNFWSIVPRDAADILLP